MNSSGRPSCIKMGPKLFPKASHSNAKVLEKSGMTKIGVLHMACFKMEKAFSISTFHEMEFFLSRFVKGAEILP